MVNYCDVVDCLPTVYVCLSKLWKEISVMCYCCVIGSVFYSILWYWFEVDRIIYQVWFPQMRWLFYNSRHVGYLFFRCEKHQYGAIVRKAFRRFGSELIRTWRWQRHIVPPHMTNIAFHVYVTMRQLQFWKDTELDFAYHVKPRR